MAGREDESWWSYGAGRDNMTGESTYNPGTPALPPQQLHTHFADDAAGAGLFPSLDSASPRRVPVPPTRSPGGREDSWDQRSPRKTHVLSSSLDGQTFVNKISQASALEEKRRTALLERQRAAVRKEESLKMTAETRVMALHTHARDMELKRQHEETRMEAQLRADGDKETRRAQMIAERQEAERQEAIERRRMVEMAKRREGAVHQLEMNRRQAAEEERIRRQAIVARRTEMLRIQEVAAAQFRSRRVEEKERQNVLLTDMERVRGRRLDELERRRADPVIQGQIREFQTLVQLQDAIQGIVSRLNAVQLEREGVREQILDSRYQTELLDRKERALSLSVEEVALDLNRMRAYSESLAHLVSSKYGNECDIAVLTIQRWYRKSKSKTVGQAMRALLREKKLNREVAKLQSLFRGRKTRRQVAGGRMFEHAVHVQCAVRSCLARRAVRLRRREVARARAAHLLPINAATMIQNAWRTRIARAVFRVRIHHRLYEYQAIRSERQDRDMVSQKLHPHRRAGAPPPPPRPAPRGGQASRSPAREGVLPSPSALFASPTRRAGTVRRAAPQGVLGGNDYFDQQSPGQYFDQQPDQIFSVNSPGRKKLGMQGPYHRSVGGGFENRSSLLAVT